MPNVYKLLLSLVAASTVVSAEQSMRQTPDFMDDDMPCAEDTESEIDSAAAGLLALLHDQFQLSTEMLQGLFRSIEEDDVTRSNDAEDADRFDEMEDVARLMKAENVPPFNDDVPRFNEDVPRFNEDVPRFNEVVPRFNEDVPRFNEADDLVRVVMIEQEKDESAVERKTACLKAVEIIHEQEELHKQTETFMKYIRSAFDMVSLRVWGGASCDDLGRAELVDQCNLVVKSNSVVQKFLIEGKTEDQVCDIMSTVSDLDATDNLSCQLCQRFAQMVDQALTQDVQRVEQVGEIIGDLCNSPLCHAFPENYNAVVDWMKHGTESSAVCSRLAMC